MAPEPPVPVHPDLPAGRSGTIVPPVRRRYSEGFHRGQTCKTQKENDQAETHNCTVEALYVYGWAARSSRGGTGGLLGSMIANPLFDKLVCNDDATTTLLKRSALESDGFECGRSLACQSYKQ